ncbi:MAG: FAD:protein FMN transferase [Bacteroidales bacterium]|nr:FAD:protein FMN transferase [Bacteroidales bacterium]
MKYFLIAVLCVSLISCNSKREKEFYFYEGPIQGTTFHITYEWDKDLARQIDSLLQNFNKSLSNYDPNSKISQFNQNLNNETDDLVVAMIESAQKVYDNTNGAFDITVAPIVNAWGFGWVRDNNNQIPDSMQIDSLLRYVGMNKVRLENNLLVKDYPQTMIITNAIAQGLSVDYVSEYLFELGVRNFLVEIGGEVFCFGVNNKKEPWRIGIDKPIEGSGQQDRENQIIINLSGKAIATSGNYRKFVEDGKEKYGHSIDPRTGYPAQNELLSVSVIGENCMECDAYATAFMVAGLDESLKIAEGIKGIEAYFIYIDQDSNVRTIATSGFETYTLE